ncbi:MAG: hypothetical protein CTY12_00570 [Methylotenera sp.]|nr:MAG: hypothetical protein CTY12_00570 [Methylotenera sp.]
MLIHLLLSIIFTTSLSTTLNFSKYIHFLYHNISLALQHYIQQELSNNQYFKIALDKSITNHLMYTRIFLPLSLTSLINSIIIWILIYIEYQLPDWYIISSTIVFATTFTKYITQDQFPNWFIHWSKLIHATRDEINLQLLRTKLQDIHSQLQDVINGKQLSESELLQLKFEGLLLAQQAESLSKQLQQYK